MIYLGIDPGSRNCGYGVMQVEGSSIIAVYYNIIKLKVEDDLSLRIKAIYDEITRVINDVHPDKVAVETIFYGKNVKSAFTLGHVRGAIILAIAQNQLPIYEFSPREIKKGVTGNGNASKQQIQYMLPKLLGLQSKSISEDEADALAVAFCLYNKDRYGSGPLLKK